MSIGCNTLYVHVRPFGDAIYDSELYPASRYITGMAGEQGGFDPLDIMIQTAHDKGLSFHAWINPLRCENEECFQNYDDSFLLKSGMTRATATWNRLMATAICGSTLLMMR